MAALAVGCTGHLRIARHPSPSHRRQLASKGPHVSQRPGGGGRRHPPPPPRVRRPSREEFDANRVQFDDEEDWEQSGTTVQGPSLGPILSTALRGLLALTDQLTEAALQVAPADASPAVVRVAVNAALVLLSLSFVKSLLSFFLTLGTIILGAYVAVKVFGVDVGGRGSGPGGPSARGGGPGGGKPRPKQQQKRRLDPRSRQSEFRGLLGSGGGEEDGLLDVWFERKGGDGGTGGERARRR